MQDKVAGHVGKSKAASNPDVRLMVATAAAGVGFPDCIFMHTSKICAFCHKQYVAGPDLMPNNAASADCQVAAL